MKRLIWGQATNIGLVREQNEDAVFSFGAEIDGSIHQVIGLFIVADGMGGRDAGTLASSLAIRVTASHLMQSVIIPLITNNPYNSISEAITATIRGANMTILELGKQDPNLHGTGLTIDKSCAS